MQAKLSPNFLQKFLSSSSQVSNKDNLSIPIAHESSSGFPASSAKPGLKPGVHHLEFKEAHHKKKRSVLSSPPPLNINTSIKVSPLKAIQEALTFAQGVDSLAENALKGETEFVAERLSESLVSLRENIQNFSSALEKMPASPQRDALLAKTMLLKAAHAYFPKNASDLIKMRQWLSEQNIRIKDSILIFLHSSHTNGANKVGIDLAKSAKNYAQPMVIMPESDGDVPENLHQEGIPTAVISPKQLGNKAYQKAVSEQGAGAKLAVLNTLMNFQLTEPLKKQGTKVVGVVHEGLPIKENPVQTREALEQFIQNTFKRDDFRVSQLVKVFDEIDAVIVPCKAELENYTTLAPEHTRDKFKPILNGVSLKLADQTMAQFTPESAREAIGIDKEAFVVLQLATFYQRKSNRTTIAAGAELKKIWENSGKNGAKPTLLLVGGRISKAQEARYISQMVADIKSLGLKANFGTDQVHEFKEGGKTHRFKIPEFIQPDDQRFESGKYDAILLPVMDQSFCLKAHRAASVNVCPSLSELLPLSILESMAMQVPQVASNIAGIPEVVKPNQNGYLIEPGNAKQLTQALDQLRQSPEKARELGLQARSRVQDKHTMDRMLNAYEKTIKALT